ncbi:MAG: hypothetical protein IPK58_19305 [Acidobacteria bacterium]|nr:hypothetical protein [Acidobacteriota bacterium]
MIYRPTIGIVDDRYCGCAVTVILEKLLLFQLDVTVVELPPDVIPVTVPPAPVLLNAVTIELLLIVDYHPQER